MVNKISSFALTDDFFLGNRLQIHQPVQGYRAAIDPVFLAALVPAKNGERILEVGGGVGVASCCLAMRLPDIHLTGVELFPELATLAERNHKRNGFSYQSIVGDVRDLPYLGAFDHVMSNPPFGAKGKERLSPIPFKSHAHTESSVTLKAWIHFCLKHLKPKGTLSLIFKTGRLNELLVYLEAQIGDIQLIPLWPKEQTPSKRILLRGRKQSRGALTLMPGLILHHEDGSYTPAAEKILKQGHPL